MGLGSLTTKVLLLGHQGQRGVSTVREKPMASARDLTRGDGDKAASWRGFGRGRREQMQFCFRTFTVPPVQPNSVNRPSGGTCVPAAGAARGSGPLRCSLNFPWACALPGFRLACAENTPSRSRTRQACATPASRARALGSRTCSPRSVGPEALVSPHPRSASARDLPGTDHGQLGGARRPQHPAAGGSPGRSARCRKVRRGAGHVSRLRGAPSPAPAKATTACCRPRRERARNTGSRRGARQALQGDAPCSPPFHTRRRRRDPCTASIPRWAQTPPSRLCRNGNDGAGRKDRENPISLCKLPAGREA